MFPFLKIKVKLKGQRLIFLTNTQHAVCQTLGEGQYHNKGQISNMIMAHLVNNDMQYLQLAYSAVARTYKGQGAYLTKGTKAHAAIFHLFHTCISIQHVHYYVYMYTRIS